MEARYLHEGDTIHVIPTVAIPAGAVVVLNNIVGITKSDIGAGEFGVISLCGVYEFIKGLEPFATGDFVYWDQTARQATTTATSNIYIGRATSDAASSDVVVTVRLEPISG